VFDIFTLSFVGFGFLALLLLLWNLVWKGFALWIAARHKSKVWYIVMLVLNTFGILEILYIFIFSKRKKHPHDHKKH
jgi:hypothetical protein